MDRRSDVSALGETILRPVLLGLMEATSGVVAPLPTMVTCQCTLYLTSHLSFLSYGCFQGSAPKLAPCVQCLISGVLWGDAKDRYRVAAAFSS